LQLYNNFKHATKNNVNESYITQFLWCVTDTTGSNVTVQTSEVDDKSYVSSGTRQCGGKGTFH